ncbi:MAG: (5-formylfuran-3-yl)methyl phosphate synthase [Burkholderiales bacterium]|nr:(5-formylfuran-3-yl)methyl phosphate synthase [Burkholderiales bacterium]MDE2454380.1 (5-formylfuran-3-yl)methyl phosphate synthase [Burkholderiales bacterium]
MMRLLVSVRDVDETLAAVRAGVDFVDFKEPGAGALGGLPLATIRALVDALHDEGVGLPLSATIGDLTDPDAIRAQVDAVGRCGVDYVKVGIQRDDPAAPALLEWLSDCGHAVVPVFIADQGIDPELVAMAAELPFPALMADTADKLAGSLFDVAGLCELHAFVEMVRGAGKLAGLAGALQLSHIPVLMALETDFAGFRSAVCQGDRAGTLDPALLARLRAALRPAQAPARRSWPSSSERMRVMSVR